MAGQYTKEAIRGLLERSDKAVEQATIRLWERQTADEQQAQQTGHKNGEGFNGTDAEILSSFAEQLQGIGSYTWNGRTYTRKGPKPLSDKQMEIARRKVVKYAGQLAEIANAKAQADAQATAPVAPAPVVAPALTAEQSSKLEALDAIARQLATVQQTGSPEAGATLGKAIKQAKDAGLWTIQAQRYVVAQAGYLQGTRTAPADQPGDYHFSGFGPGNTYHDEAHPAPLDPEPEFDETTAELIAAGVIDPPNGPAPETPAPKPGHWTSPPIETDRDFGLRDDAPLDDAITKAPEPERLPGSVCLCPEPCDIHSDPSGMTNAQYFDMVFGPDPVPTERREIKPSDSAHLGPAPSRYARRPRGQATMRHFDRAPQAPNRIRC